MLGSLTRARNTVAAGFGLALGLFVTPLLAESQAGAKDAGAEAPLSAIEWLSQSVALPPRAEPPVTATAAPPRINVAPLAAASRDPIGLLPPHVTGLPETLWASSDEAVLIELLSRGPVEMLPALQDLLRQMMLAEAAPPAGASREAALFLARVDKLLDLGLIEPAQALIERASPDTPALFRRWFDVALLTGTEDRACSALQDTPGIAPTVSARIFCLARTGDWPAAALILNTQRALGDISPADDALLARFLDPELFEQEPPLPLPSRVSPLSFRMHEAIGEPLATATLPIAFAHADLRSTTAWKTRIEAAERLARRGAVSENVLQKQYTARTPAASGGIWERARALQNFEQARQNADPAAMATSLPAAWQAMQTARTEIPFSKLYAADLAVIATEQASADLVLQIGLLSSDFEDFAAAPPAVANLDPFLIAIALGIAHEMPANSARAAAIQAGFDNGPLPSDLQALLDSAKLGEALLQAIALFDAGTKGDLRLVTDALRVLRAAGLEDTARRASLQMMILERRG